MNCMFLDENKQRKSFYIAQIEKRILIYKKEIKDNKGWITFYKNKIKEARKEIKYWRNKCLS